MDAVERGASAENFQFVDRLPAQEGAEQPAQPEDMIEVSVRKQDARQAFESDPRLQDLALRPLAAVHEETIFVVADDLRRKSAFRRWGGGRGAEKKNFEQRESFKKTVMNGDELDLAINERLSPFISGKISSGL